MKKIKLILITIVILASLAGCSNNNKKDELSLNDFIVAFEDQGIKSVEDDKSFFTMIGASDGVMFESEDKIVIYEYKSEKDLKKAEEDYEIIKEMNTNGRFLLETSNQDAIDIFTSLKK